MYCTNATSQGYQGSMKFRIYTTNEVAANIEIHYESSDEYIGNPVVSGWQTDGNYDYYEIDFGNRALVPGERVGFKGGMAASGGGIDLSNDWSLADIGGSSSTLERVVVYMGGQICAGEPPSGSVTPAPTAIPTATPVVTQAPTSVPTATPVPTIAPTGTVSRGDVNGSRTIDIVDALLVAQYYVGLPVTIDLTAADSNCNGVVDIVDALLIAQYYVGLISQFC